LTSASALNSSASSGISSSSNESSPLGRGGGDALGGGGTPGDGALGDGAAGRAAPVGAVPVGEVPDAWGRAGGVWPPRGVVVALGDPGALRVPWGAAGSGALAAGLGDVGAPPDPRALVPGAEAPAVPGAGASGGFVKTNAPVA
jgi:hypothetical protein